MSFRRFMFQPIKRAVLLHKEENVSLTISEF